MMVHTKTMAADCYRLPELYEYAEHCGMSRHDIHSVVWKICEQLLCHRTDIETLAAYVASHTVALADEIYACHLSRIDPEPLLEVVGHVVSELTGRFRQHNCTNTHWSIKDLKINYDTVLTLRLEGWDDVFDQPTLVHM